MHPNIRRIAAFALLVSLVSTACSSRTSDDSTAETTAPSTAPTTTAGTELDVVATTAAPETESDPAQALPSTTPPPTAADVLSGSALAIDGQRTEWSGVIDDTINFSMWLAQRDGFLRGELTYDTSGQPIALLGRSFLSGNGYFLHEFGDDGRVSGTLILGDVLDGNISNAWWGDRDLDLRFAGVADEPYFFDPLVRPGIYTYSFAPFGDSDDGCCGPSGKVQISAVTGNSLLLNIQNVTSGPGFNLASVEPTELPLVNNVARYEATDAEIGLDCAFDVTVFDGFAFIDYVDERFDCLFGNAAGVEGIYVLTGSVVEPADSPFANATLTSTTFGSVALGDTWRSLTDRFDVAPYDPASDVFGTDCYYVNIRNDSLSPWFMLLGDGEDAVVSRIEPALPTQRADSGIGVGDTEADVDAVYGDAVLKDPHVYLGDGAKYLRVAPEAGADATILFETKETGEIVSLRNGYLDPIRWVEGCA